MVKYYFILCFLLVAVFHTDAQYSRYIIRFKDKKGTPHSIGNPATYLSPKAIARRTNSNIAIDSTDLPVSPAYIDSIRSVPNVVILNKSKWLNQVCINITAGTATSLAAINAFTFVKQSNPVSVKTIAGTTSFTRSLKKMDMPSADSSNGIDQPTGVTSNYFNYGNSLPQIHIHEGEFLHNLGFRGEGITIAILDGGFQSYLTNPAFDSVRLTNRILGTWDYVNNETSVNEDNVHGSNCFSIIAANRPGTIVGAAPLSKFWLLRTEDVNSEYPIEEQNWVAAAEFADSAGVDMISSSLGYIDFDDPSFDHSYAQRNGNTAIITIGADLAAKKGILVSNSAGNEGGSNTDMKYVGCPADGDSVLAVGAVDVSGNIAAISSWGPNSAGKVKPNVVSVGSGTIYANNSGNAVAGLGTSYSNPNMCGLIGCLWQAFPELSNMDIIDAVQKSAHKYNNPDARFGYGIPNFKKAFSALVVKKFQGAINPDGCVATLNWSSKDNNAMHYDVERKLPGDTGFIKIASVTGKTAGFQINNYSLNDTLKTISPATVQYRLKQVIADTSIVLSNFSHVVTDPCIVIQKTFTVGPNPFKGAVSLYINYPSPMTNLFITLTDTKGSMVYQYQGTTSGAIGLNIPAERLAAGLYLLTIRDGKKIIFTKKLLK